MLVVAVTCHGGEAALPPAAKAVAPDWPVVFREGFDGGFAGWTPRESSVWVQAGGANPHLKLATRGEPGPIRAPLSWVVRPDQKPEGSFILSARGKCHTSPDVPGRDLLLVIAWNGPLDYTYIHFSAENSPVHNVIMRVKPEGRTLLAHASRPVPKLLKQNWQTIRVWYDKAEGLLRCYVDDMETPVMTCRIGELATGAVGVGSFDDMVEFDDITLATEPAR